MNAFGSLGWEYQSCLVPRRRRIVPLAIRCLKWNMSNNGYKPILCSFVMEMLLTWLTARMHTGFYFIFKGQEGLFDSRIMQSLSSALRHYLQLQLEILLVCMSDGAFFYATSISDKRLFHLHSVSLCWVAWQNWLKEMKVTSMLDVISVSKDRKRQLVPSSSEPNQIGSPAETRRAFTFRITRVIRFKNWNTFGRTQQSLLANWIIDCFNFLGSLARLFLADWIYTSLSFHVEVNYWWSPARFVGTETGVTKYIDYVPHFLFLTAY